MTITLKKVQKRQNKIPDKRKLNENNQFHLFYYKIFSTLSKAN